MLLSIKILKEVVHPYIQIQSLFTHPHGIVTVQNGTQRIMSKLFSTYNGELEKVMVLIHFQSREKSSFKFPLNGSFCVPHLKESPIRIIKSLCCQMMHLVDILKWQNMNKSWKVSTVMLLSLRDNLDNDQCLQSLL